MEQNPLDDVWLLFRLRALIITYLLIAFWSRI